MDHQTPTYPIAPHIAHPFRPPPDSEHAWPTGAGFPESGCFDGAGEMDMTAAAISLQVNSPTGDSVLTCLDDVKWQSQP